MDKKSIHINYLESRDVNEFDEKVQKLIIETIEFAQNAYAPYSRFKVSACLILETGEILKGSNIENASYPVSICAERTLLSHAVSNYPNTKIDIITIYVDKDLETAVSPCGLCRQTLLEVESRQDQKIKIILISKSGNFIQFESCADLLPFNFNSDFL
jgi:cytidine deaminase